MTMTARTYYHRLQLLLQKMDFDALEAAISMIEQAWKEGRQVITLGNGGSAITSLHFIVDWNKCLFELTKRPFRGRSLVDNAGTLTAYGNDVAFEDIFTEQLKNIMQPEDLVIAISGSGNSENVIRAVQYANTHGGRTLGLCGFDGGRLKSLAQHAVWADSDDMQLVEDIHATFGHVVLQVLGQNCDQNSQAHANGLK